MELTASQRSEYHRYCDLVLERDELLRESAIMQIRYIREFGMLILESLKAKEKCIIYKKKLTYCRMMTGQGKVIRRKNLEEYAGRDAKMIGQQILMMRCDIESARKATIVTEATALKAKSIYRGLALRLHPDINPVTGISLEQRKFWNEIAEAYYEGDVPLLEKLAGKAIEEGGQSEDGEKFISDLKEKIVRMEEQINVIISTDPYRFRDLLKNAELVREKREGLEREICDYRAYLDDMQEQFDEVFKSRRVRFVLDLNTQ